MSFHLAGLLACLGFEAFPTAGGQSVAFISKPDLAYSCGYSSRIERDSHFKDIPEKEYSTIEMQN